MEMGLDIWMEEFSNFSSGAAAGCSSFGWRAIFPDIIRYFREYDGEESTYGGLELRTGSWLRLRPRRTVHSTLPEPIRSPPTAQHPLHYSTNDVTGKKSVIELTEYPEISSTMEQLIPG